MIKKLFIGLLAITLLTGCGKEKPKDDVSSSSKQEEKEERKLKIIDETKKTRPYAVMINNIDVARPLQSGLQDAYIVYELIVEGGITRMMALFRDTNTGRIGSIRSARHYYLDYALENDAIYVHVGESPQAGSDITKLGVTELSGSSWYFRDKKLNVATEHTVFTSMKSMNEVKVSRRETNKELLLNYSIDNYTYEGTSANEVSIKYSNYMTVDYKYDAELGLYLRSTKGKSHKDYVTDKQYTVKNIIAYAIKNHDLSDNQDKGRQDIENIGTGKGVYISNGIFTPITWEKSSRSAQTIYKTEDGKELIVNDGNTFIQIYPTSGNIEIK